MGSCCRMVDRKEGWTEFGEIESGAAHGGQMSVIVPPISEIAADPAKLAVRHVVGGPAVPARDGPQDKEKELFKNGKTIVSVWPENTSCAWVLPPRYNPYSMPSILASQGIQMLPDDYVTALELITNDYRFRSYSSLYGRLLALWMTFCLVLLLIVLFANPQGGVPVLVFCFTWCVVVLIGILICCVLRKQIRVGMRHAVQSANKILLKHNVVAGVEDRGQISCHKVVIHLFYFDVANCQREIERQLRIRDTGGAVLAGDSMSAENGARVDVAEQARQLILKYSQGYVKDSCRNRIIFPTRPSLGVSEFAPLHCEKKYCFCQYIEKQHFNRRPRKWYERFV